MEDGTCEVVRKRSSRSIVPVEAATPKASRTWTPLPWVRWKVRVAHDFKYGPHEFGQLPLWAHFTPTMLAQFQTILAMAMFSSGFAEILGICDTDTSEIWIWPVQNHCHTWIQHLRTFICWLDPWNEQHYLLLWTTYVLNSSEPSEVGFLKCGWLSSLFVLRFVMALLGQIFGPFQNVLNPPTFSRDLTFSFPFRVAVPSPPWNSRRGCAAEVKRPCLGIVAIDAKICKWVLSDVRPFWMAAQFQTILATIRKDSRHVQHRDQWRVDVVCQKHCHTLRITAVWRCSSVAPSCDGWGPWTFMICWLVVRTTYVLNP